MRAIKGNRERIIRQLWRRDRIGSRVWRPSKQDRVCGPHHSRDIMIVADKLDTDAVVHRELVRTMAIDAIDRHCNEQTKRPANR